MARKALVGCRNALDPGCRTELDLPQAVPKPQRAGLRLRTAGKPKGERIVPQAQVVSHFFGSFVVIDIPNNLLNCLSSRSSEGRRAKAGCSSGAGFIIYIIGLFCCLQSIVQGSCSVTSHLMCLRETKSLDCVPHPCNWKKYCRLFLPATGQRCELGVLLHAGFPSPSTECLCVLCRSVFDFNSKDSYELCYVLEIKESKACLLFNFVSPQVGLRKWDWGGRNWHPSPVYCSKAQVRCQVRGLCQPPLLSACGQSILHIWGKIETPPGIKFQGRIQSWYQEQCPGCFLFSFHFQPELGFSFPPSFGRGYGCAAPAPTGSRHALGWGMRFFPLPCDLASLVQAAKQREVVTDSEARTSRR